MRGRPVIIPAVLKIRSHYIWDPGIAKKLWATNAIFGKCFWFFFLMKTHLRSYAAEWVANVTSWLHWSAPFHLNSRYSACLPIQLTVDSVNLNYVQCFLAHDGLRHSGECWCCSGSPIVPLNQSCQLRSHWSEWSCALSGYHDRGENYAR